MFEMINAIMKHCTVALLTNAFDRKIHLSCIKELATQTPKSYERYVDLCKTFGLTQFYTQVSPKEEQSREASTQLAIDTLYPKYDASKMPQANDVLFKCGYCGSKLIHDEESLGLMCSNVNCKGV